MHRIMTINNKDLIIIRTKCVENYNFTLYNQIAVENVHATHYNDQINSFHSRE